MIQKCQDHLIRLHEIEKYQPYQQLGHNISVNSGQFLPNRKKNGQNFRIRDPIHDLNKEVF